MTTRVSIGAGRTTGVYTRTASSPLRRTTQMSPAPSPSHRSRTFNNSQIARKCSVLISHLDIFSHFRAICRDTSHGFASSAVLTPRIAIAIRNLPPKVLTCRPIHYVRHRTYHIGNPRMSYFLPRNVTHFSYHFDFLRRFMAIPFLRLSGFGGCRSLSVKTH